MKGYQIQVYLSIFNLWAKGGIFIMHWISTETKTSVSAVSSKGHPFLATFYDKQRVLLPTLLYKMWFVILLYYCLTYYIKCDLLFLTVSLVLFLISCLMKQLNCFLVTEWTVAMQFQASVWYSIVKVIRMLFIKQRSTDFKVANNCFYRN